MTDLHDQGLLFDLATLQRLTAPLLNRRAALRLAGGLGLLALVGCASDKNGPAVGSTTSGQAGAAGPTATSSGGASTAACTTISSETAGPFPGDGSNGPNVLNQSGAVRSDIRSSFGSSSTIADGVPLTVVLALQKQANGCAPYSGAAVYLWHCDRVGRYSMYDSEIPSENYLRGVQAAGDDGIVTFKTIFPGGYSGRYPHIHFEVFENLQKAASGSKLRTSQLAMPEAACDLAYAAAGYEASAQQMTRTTLSNDGVFRDGAATQTPTFTGDASSGITIRLNVPV